MAKVIITDGYSYVSDGSDIITNLHSLSDVQIYAATSGQVLASDSFGIWSNQDLSTVTNNYVALNNLSDVTITSASEGHILRLNASNEWVNTDIVTVNTNAVQSFAETLQISYDGEGILSFDNSSGTINYGDSLGAMEFTTGGIQYGRISLNLIDSTSSSETGTMLFQVKQGGQFNSQLVLNGEWNETSVNSEYLAQYNNGSSKFYLINSTSPGTSSSESGRLFFGGYDDGGAYLNYSYITGHIIDTTDGSETGHLEIVAMNNGSSDTVVYVSNTQVIVDNRKLVSQNGFVNNATNYGTSAFFSRDGQNVFAAVMQNTTGSNLASGDYGNIFGWEIIANDAYAYPGFIKTQYDGANGNSVIITIYDDGVNSYNENEIFEVAEQRVSTTRPFNLAGYESTALPNGNAGDMIAISDDGYKPAYFDGSDWRYVSDNTTV